ncbi:hypothetical protein Vadar_032194 [Vaccinium darrowii]|uniref:Uncharacterized protein n=1 Tax=Vaccinium darrowii TaxID=229202 RepID=A0ACB7XLC9_9ERIC|nr:hypothetical protein Vadar_032194 [Vaccinium darrowii]
MVDAVVSFVVERLGSLLIEQVVFLHRVKDDVIWLKRQLQYLLGFLKDAEEKQEVDHRMREWVSDIRDVAYEAEDIIDNFILKVEAEAEAGTPKKMGLKDCFKKYFCICSKHASLIQQANLYGIGQEINTLRTKLNQIEESRVTFGIRNIDDARDGSDRMNAYRRQNERPYKDNEHVVGFKEDADTLMSELDRKVKDRYVISIVGTGGLGKTTLARKLYNNLTPANKFDCYGWVSVSNDYKIEDLLRSTIKSFKTPTTKDDLELLEKMKVEDLERHLRDYLKGHRYLVVLDDVWDKNAWPSLMRAFPNENNGSRVIMTTRNKDVAKSCDERTYLHELPFLKDEESWELFCSKAFPVYDDDGDENQKSRCPPHLENLAREMVGKCHGLPLAIVLLGGLLRRKDYGEWPKLKEHIWRHSKELNFLHIYRETLASNSRRVASYSPLQRFISLDPSDMRLRTLLFFNLEDKNPEMAHLQWLCKNLRLLRVLDHGFKVHGPAEEIRLPDEIRKLIHLRYLGLPGSKINALSQFVGNLHALQTLELNTSNFSKPIQLPDEICKAKQLRHLIGQFRWPFRVDNLTNLRTLYTVFVQDQMEFDPMNLINLRELHVDFGGEGDNRITLDSIGGLRSLQSLEIRLSRKNRRNLEVHLHPLTRCQNLLQLRLKASNPWSKGDFIADWKWPTEVLPNLKFLFLDAESLTEDPMPFLETLPKLAVLQLMDIRQEKLVCTAGGFPQLEILEFWWDNLVNEIQVEEGGMPVLTGLYFEGGIRVPDRLRSILYRASPLNPFEWAY